MNMQTSHPSQLPHPSRQIQSDAIRALFELAQTQGIQAEWWDEANNPHTLSEDACRELLQAIAIPADTNDAVTQALTQHQQRWLEPVMVTTKAPSVLSIPVHLPDTLRDKTFVWRLSTEDGDDGVLEETFTMAELVPQDTPSESGSESGWRTYRLHLYEELEPGYHHFTIQETESGQSADMLLVIAPERCYLPLILAPANAGETETSPLPAEPIPEARTGKIWGPAIQLAAVSSERNWGMGDWTDLKRLIDWSAEAGAAVIGLNPISALFPHNQHQLNPYRPSSRHFFNILHLDVEAIEDFKDADDARSLVFSPAFQDVLQVLRQEALLPVAEIARRKLDVLELLYRHFSRHHLADGTARGREFKKYVKHMGRRLERFALHEALQERFYKDDPNITGWPEWPEAYQNPDSAEVWDFAESNRERIEFYQYLQWQADLQMHGAGIRCLEHGLGVGLCIEVPSETAWNGAEVWADRHLFADCAAFDQPSEAGVQSTTSSFPPIAPERLRADHYQSFIDMLRQNMHHAGAIRIDRVLHWLRLFWMPKHRSSMQSALVSYPIDELLGILALESHRSQCMVIAQDGTELPDDLQSRLERKGIYTGKLFLPNQDSDAVYNEEGYPSPADLPEQAALMLGTTDDPPLAGFWEGRDIALRTELNLYPSKEIRDRQIRNRSLARIGLLSALEQENVLPEGFTTDPASIRAMTPELARAIHGLIARSASKLCLIRLEDMLLQTEPVHLSGAPETTYPNWRQRLPLALEAWTGDPQLAETTRILTEERPHRPVPGKLFAIFTEAQTERTVPQATYRFQFNEHFTFRQAAELVPYLHRLGVSHCYASPLLTARPGSAHGYDITNHNMLNSEIGSREDFDHLSRTLREHDMGLIVDIVPNHMGAGKDNPWWMDVLENGPSSLYADYFDIDWNPLAEDLRNKLLLPILGDSYGKILENGELKLRFDEGSGRFWLDYYEHAIPINPNAYPAILNYRLDVLETRLGNNNTALFEYQSIINSFENLPVETGDDFTRRESRSRERVIALNRLLQLCGNTPEISHFIQENVQDFQPRKEDVTTVNRLHRLLEQQSYRLANWRVASDEINYRRFFDINDLVAIRVEDQRVFNDTHALIMELIENGQIQGLRIDHPDGLYDPAAYFQRLQQETARRLHLPETSDWKLGAANLPFYVIIEKILAPFERLPEEWTVHGTTGYEFANAVNGLFVNQENEREMTRIYEKLLDHKIHFEDLVYQCKKLIMKTTLNSELGVLSHQLNQISKRNWSFRDFTLHNLRSALMEVVACFPVYRTYITPDSISRKDREYIEWAVRAAKRRSTAEDTSIFDFIHHALLLEAQPEAPHNVPDGEEENELDGFRKAMIRFAMKFQQYTGPVMAKGLEDTSFYRYNRLISLNEVGGEPRQFGISVSTFHHQNQERARRAPHTLLATSTHDTKRSEDMRARISVLSEMPEEWQRHLSHWRRLHRKLRKSMEDGKHAPVPNAEYLFYQTLIGFWPLKPPSPQELAQLADRLEQYMLKAVKEAKRHTSWINPNLDYEEALSNFVRGVVQRPSSLFMDDFVPFQRMIARYGLFNSLSQTLLKLTVPGVPDLYQGTELWDFSLVDPDNRRPVDYGQRQDLLHSMLDLVEKQAQQSSRERESMLADMTANLTDGRLKQFLIASVLRLRQQEAELFREGDYMPLEVSGTHADHIVAFARRLEDRTAIIVAPRLLYTLSLMRGGPRRMEMPFGKRTWRDTTLVLPSGLASQPLRNVLTGDTIVPDASGLPVADILTNMPVGLLFGENLPSG